MVKYYKIDDKTDSCFEADVPKAERIFRPGACLQCSSLPKNMGPPQSLVVRDNYPPYVPRSFTSWLYGVLHSDLLECLKPEISDCLHLGEMRTASGNMIHDYRTFVGTETVFLRGTKESQHHLCDACGSLIYSPLPRASSYVTSSAIVSRRPIYEIRIMGLLISDVMLRRIDYRIRTFLNITEIPIRDEPLDGLPAELGIFPTTEQLIDYKPNRPPWMGTKN